MSEPVILSVRLMTYNHSKHIIECLNSIENQVTDFFFEVIIGDDFSTDNNLELIKKFIQSSQNKNITYILLNRTKGDYYDLIRQKKGRLYNFANIIEHCKGKYIALLDGDDYWTDSFKLQKQIDFLEANPEFNICFTRANILKDNKINLHPIPNISDEGIYTYNDLLNHHNFITTASVVYRNKITIPEWFFNLPYGDLGLYGIISKKSKLKCLTDITTTYRIHEQGLWSKTNNKEKTFNILKFNKIIYTILTNEQRKTIQTKQLTLIKNISYQLQKKNRLLRILTRIKLSIKYNL